jgi:hypothetical protein
MSENTAMELISLESAEGLFGIKRATIRSWIRDDKVAGRKKKPYTVDRADLEAFVMEGANEKLKELYSKRFSSGRHAPERSADVDL